MKGHNSVQIKAEYLSERLMFNREKRLSLTLFVPRYFQVPTRSFCLVMKHLILILMLHILPTTVNERPGD